ncbi:unnamed protein product [Dracunculus medinensis]|uniref:Uncharacterized protein n=1 Tax=Dracunculus medinensis TaxID=318479 RepID=A0A0N4U4T9_DRAME|nr:unnamed protein product [Dracunculus medinensis]
MNELLAILVIVIICCAMFFAWLASMATCPDAIVDFISGKRPSEYSSSSRNSKEFANQDHEIKVLSTYTSPTYLQLNNTKKISESKKLSIVSEKDEQLTIQSDQSNAVQSTSLTTN